MYAIFNGNSCVKAYFTATRWRYYNSLHISHNIMTHHTIKSPFTISTWHNFIECVTCNPSRHSASVKMLPLTISQVGSQSQREPRVENLTRRGNMALRHPLAYSASSTREHHRESSVTREPKPDLALISSRDGLLMHRASMISATESRSGQCDNNAETPINVVTSPFPLSSHQ